MLGRSIRSRYLRCWKSSRGCECNDHAGHADSCAGNVRPRCCHERIRVRSRSHQQQCSGADSRSGKTATATPARTSTSARACTYRQRRRRRWRWFHIMVAADAVGRSGGRADAQDGLNGSDRASAGHGDHRVIAMVLVRSPHQRDDFLLLRRCQQWTEACLEIVALPIRLACRWYHCSHGFVAQ